MPAPTFDASRLAGGERALFHVVDLVCRAGELALGHFRRGVHVEKKADRSPVTIADRSVEDLLRSGLLELFPDHGFLGEETGDSGMDSAYRWIVDPIDGTRAFTRGLDSWSILVGLEAVGTPVFGVALLPARGDLYVGLSGSFANKNGRSITLSGVASLDDALVMHGGLEQFRSAEGFGLLSKLGNNVYSARGFGDMAGYAALLDGTADAVVDPGVKAWDLCAVATIVRQAGGRLTDFGGVDTIWGGAGLASNGHLHDPLVALLGAA